MLTYPRKLLMVNPIRCSVGADLGSDSAVGCIMGTRIYGTISSSVTSVHIVCRLHAPLTEKQPTLLRLKNKQIKCANSIYKILNRFAYFSVGTIGIESSSLNIVIKYMGGILIYVPTKKKLML